MTKKIFVTDEEYGKFCLRTDELKRRLKEGTLDYERTMNKLQKLIEGGMCNKSVRIPYSFESEYDDRKGGICLL